MSGLRRRIINAFRDTTPSPSPSPVSGTPPPGEDVRLVSVAKLKTLTAKKGGKRRNGLIFGLGGLFGILLAVFFANQQDVIKLEGFMELNLDSLLDVIPAGIVRDARDLTKSEREAVNYDSFSVGLQLQAQGIKANHPVIMIPGVISTGLESWGTDESSRPYFRKRLWGSWSMMRALIMDKASWKRHIMLDKETGLDPPGIKLRAAQGFDAADFFITGYWIWNKILENLATIGYDPTNAFTAAYDWRLNYMNLEVRDQYYTRLKSYIEVSVHTSGKKTVLISHSMGSQVLLYFFKWVENPSYGGGGTDWVETYVDSWINISGCMLGALKSVSAVLSGEMRDTAQLNAFAVYGTEKFLNKDERAEIFRAMPGISSMLPKGGDAVWGNHTWAPDDDTPPRQNVSFGDFLNFQKAFAANVSHNASFTDPDVHIPPMNLTVSEAFQYLMSHSEPWYRNQIYSSYSHGIAHTEAEVIRNDNRPPTWMNPLETRLPHAPSMKIYCFYGVGKATERGYFYRSSDSITTTNLNVTIDTTHTSPNGYVDHGVYFGEGDGTVNLLSTGYMCAKGWRDIKRYNPAGIKITTYEMPHEPDRFSPRGGPNTGDHVDILGRSSLNDLILRVAGGRGDAINDTFVTKIREYSEKVKIFNDESGEPRMPEEPRV